MTVRILTVRVSPWNRPDNVKLYEKIKFLQSYSGKGQTAAMSDNTVVRYSSEYDQKLDPFTSFTKRERMRKYMDLSKEPITSLDLRPYDKITLGVGRFIMGNKLARTIVFFYTILLHMLVFLVLYKLAYTSSCKRDMAMDNWHEKFAEHMLKVHGGEDTHGVVGSFHGGGNDVHQHVADSIHQHVADSVHDVGDVHQQVAGT